MTAEDDRFHDDELGLSQSHHQMQLIQSVRLGFSAAILLISIAYQMIQPQFIGWEVLLPLYSVLMISFLVNTGYLMFIRFWLKFWQITALLFVFEAASITALVYFIHLNQSLFLFLYLVNIILCGFVFGKRGGFFLAFLTSILFNFLLIIGPELKGQTLMFTVILNNLSFFALAALAGLLSEQLDFMGVKLKSQSADLSKLKNLNHIIVNNIATGLLMVDRDGIIIQANPASNKILETERALVGQSVDEFVPGIREKIQGAYSVEKGMEMSRLEQEFVSDRGETLLLEIIASPVKESEGRRTGTVVIFRDLTQVRRMEFAVRQSEKLAAVGQLAAGIAHEIRNPLTSISGSIQFLKANMKKLGEEENRLMSIVLKEIDRLNNLISEFLDFVRPDQIPTDSVELAPILNELLDILSTDKAFQKDLKGSVAIVRDLAGSGAVVGHRDKLRQVFWNILINALQAMVASPQPQLNVRLRIADGRVVVSVKDNGCGMDERNLKRMFEPFHTTKPKGTGLGLAVTHKILESHKAKIFVDSKVGVGTEFVLSFAESRVSYSKTSPTS